MAPFRLFRLGTRNAHDEVRENASDFLDGQAPAGLTERIRIHLAECPDCHGFVGTLRATIAALRNLPVVEPPKSTEERIRRIGQSQEKKA
ncbi:MAG: zf-HC2 domain-containing protein [Chloroflexi bacterium]|nr:zf-HC2 domain-containing protein [Chloroflexota bacterium]